MKGQNIQKYRQKDLNLMCKTDKKARNYLISLPRNKMSNKSGENWICTNELTIHFRGQNETEYNRISFLVLFGLILFWENNRKKKRRTHQKINLKTRNQIISSPCEEIKLRPKKDWSGKSKRRKKTSQLFRDQLYFNWVKLVPIYYFSHLFVVAEKDYKNYLNKAINENEQTALWSP